MPDLGSSVFSQTDGSNNSGTMPSWSGSAAPSTLDDAGRALQGAVTREWNWRNFTLTAGGTADAKTLTYSVAPAAYYNGQRFAFLANTTNTGSATLNVNSLGAKTIKKDVSGTLTNLSASDMVSGMFVEVAYNTANDCFVWVNQGIGLNTANTFTANQVISVTDNTNPALRVTQVGIGLALRIEDSTNPDSTPVVVDASGYVGIGTASPPYILTTQATSSGSSGLQRQIVNRAGDQTNFHRTSIVYNDSASATGPFGGYSGGVYHEHGGAFGVSAGLTLATSSANAGPITFATADTERMKIDTSGNVIVTGAGGLGYGTGSGGTVTQLTSKSTGVTLNKTNGQIVTHNANLATNTFVSFVVTNSAVAATDTVIIHRASGGSNESYIIGCDSVSAGSFRVYIRNNSGGALAEALTLNFAVIKSVTS